MSLFKKNLKKNKGFTLIELMVASSVFLVVLLSSSAAIYTVFNSNQKSKNMRSVMDNLNLSLESMSRSIRFGKNYHCGSTGTLTNPLDCGNPGSSYLTIRDMSGSQITYYLPSGGTQIFRSINGGTGYAMTSPDVNITKLVFRVYGSQPFTSANYEQPMVVVVIGGYVGVKTATRSNFTIQTTISQREIDFQ